MNFRIILLSLTLINCCCSEANRDLNLKLKLSSTIVVGSVYCDTCSNHYFSKSTHFISGAMVAIQCPAAGGLNQNFTRVSQTNQKGEFQIHLPFSPKRRANRIDHCSVKLIHSGDPNCTVPSASAASPNVLVLKSRKNGARIFSAGAFSFKPLNLPISCSQKPADENLNSINQKEFLNPIPDSPVISSPPSTASGFGVGPPSIPFQPTPPLISINIPPILNIPPLTNVLPLPSFPFNPVPGFPGIPSRSP